MALINKIREKTGVAVGIIALGLGLFVVGGDLLAPNSVLLGGSKQEVGEINGQTIGLQEYNLKIEEMKVQYALQNQKAAGDAEMDQLREQAWNMMIFETAYQAEFDALGLKVSDDELYDMVQGENVHPALVQAFTNPNTGQFDKSQIIGFLKNIDRVEASQKQLWLNFEKNLGPDRLRTKYNNLIKLTTYVTTEEAKRNYASQNAKATVSYLYVPYFSLPDSAYEPTESELSSYLAENKNSYSAQGVARLKMVPFPIIPTEADSAAIRAELEDLKASFQTSENDTAFIRSNSDVPGVPRIVNPGELPQAVQALAGEIVETSVVGPVLDGSSYKLFKLKRTQGDTNVYARASHILFRWTTESDADKKTAKDQANKILNEIKAGASFEEMARIHGTDGTSTQGGDLGWFGKGRMVAPFEKPIFAAKSKGLLPNIVETPFGYHLIKVTEVPTSLSFQMSTVELNVTASDDTRNEIFRKADYFASSLNSADDMEIKAKENGLVMQEAKTIRKGDKYINSFTGAREVVRWAFNEAKVGEVSDVKEVDNNFLVAILDLKAIGEDPTVDEFGEDIKVKVRNQKKAKFIIKKLDGLKSQSLEEMAKEFGTEATVYSMPDLTIAGNSLNGAGFEPKAIGMAFGLKDKEISRPIKGDNGVVVISTQSIATAPEMADYSYNKNQLQQSQSGRTEYFLAESVKELKKVKDERYKFF
jgi:peptidyl-prolyl cis-trans isomerase D